MSVPLTTQLFEAFLGSQEGIHSILLPDVFSSGGSKNVYTDKFARARKISGYAKNNSSAFTTNTGASAAKVVGLIPYRSTGATTTRKILFVLDDGVNEWEVWESSDDGATGTFLWDAGAGTVGQLPDAAQFGNNLYLTSGKNAPRIYNGTTIAAATLTQSPTITPTVTATGGNLKGNYLYKLVSTIGGVRQEGSAVSANTLAVDKTVTLAWTADANTNVDGYEIYRTSGTGSVFFYLTTINGRLTVAYTDNTSDETLLEGRVLEEHGDNPPTCYYCEPHKFRMWWLRTDTNPTRAYWSDAGNPRSNYSTNFLDFSDSETVGDVITGAIGNYEGLLVVFTEKAVWTVSGTGEVIGDITDWTKTRTNAQVGAITHESALRVPAGAKYTDSQGQFQTTSVTSLAYVTPNLDIRIFDGDNDTIVSYPFRDTLATLNYAQRAKVHAILDTNNDHAIWFLPLGSNTECSSAVVWNYRHGIWSLWETLPFSSSAVVDSTTTARTLLVGESASSKGAFIYTFFSGNSFDGGNVEAIWMTKTFYGIDEKGQPVASNTKRWRWVDLLFKSDEDLSITVEWLSGTAPDGGAALSSANISPGRSTLVTSDGYTVQTTDGYDIVLAESTSQQKIILDDTSGRLLHDTGIRLRITSNDTLGAWALEAFALGYQVLPGLGRRVT